MYKIYYTCGFSELLHNDGFHMDYCDTCSLSIQEKQHRVFMFVSVDDKWGDRTVEYDEGFIVHVNASWSKYNKQEYTDLMMILYSHLQTQGS